MQNSLPIRFTKGQLKLQEIIEKDLGFQTILEYEVDPYVVDCFLPEFADYKDGKVVAVYSINNVSKIEFIYG